MAVNSSIPGGDSGFVTTTGAEKLENKEFFGGTASTTNRFVLSRDTKANLDALARQDGALYYATDLKQTFLDNGADLIAVGKAEGTGEVNYNLNPDSSISTDNNNTNDVGDYISSGAGATVARTTTTADLPRAPFQTTGTKLTFAAGTGDYVRLRFRIPPADRNKKLKIEWAQLPSSYVSSTAKVELYSYSDAYVSGVTEVAFSGDNASGDSPLPNQTGVYFNEFSSDDREYYELRIVNDGATAGTITLNDFVIGPGKLHSGAVVSAWGSEYAVTTNISGGTTSFVSRRVGDSLEFYGVLSGSTWDSTGNFTASLPAGLSVNTSVLTINRQAVGHAMAFSSGLTAYVSGGLYVNQSTGDIQFYGASTDSSIWSGSGSRPFDWTNASDVMSFHGTIPILEWAGSGVLNVITQDNLTGPNLFTPTGTFTTNSTYTGVWWRVGDRMHLDYRIDFSGAPNTTSTVDVNLPSGYTIDTTALLGTDSPASPFDSALTFKDGTANIAGVAAYRSTTAFRLKYFDDFSDGVRSVNISDTVPVAVIASGDFIEVKIRNVPITEFAGSQSSLVGFTAASDTQMGLVKKNKWQKKKLTADVTTSTTISDLTFSNLAVGKTYRVTGQAYFKVNSGASDTTVILTVIHNSVNIAAALLQDSSTTTAITSYAIPPVIFVATATTVTFNSSSTSANSFIVGNNTFDQTWTMLEELDNYGTESSDF